MGHRSKLTLAERDRDHHLDQVRARLGDGTLQGADEVLAAVDALGGDAQSVADRAGYSRISAAIVTALRTPTSASVRVNRVMPL